MIGLMLTFTLATHFTHMCSHSSQPIPGRFSSRSYRGSRHPVISAAASASCPLSATPPRFRPFLSPRWLLTVPLQPSSVVVRLRVVVAGYAACRAPAASLRAGAEAEAAAVAAV